MLFRRFIILTVMIAFAAIIFINIVQAMTAPHLDFAVGDRLRQWELMEQKHRETCPPSEKVCDNRYAFVQQA